MIKYLFDLSKKARIWLILLIFLGPGFHLVAQTIKLTAYDVDEGLSNSAIADILTDKYGYKWISTGHGLNKYDGLHFETFRSNPRDTLSVRANSLGLLFEDQEANIWVTVDIGGICKFDRVSKNFHYFNYDSDQASHQNNFVISALFDKQGREWIGTRTNVNLINEKTRRFEPVVIDSFDELTVLDIHEDQNGFIWLGTTEALFKYDQEAKKFIEVKDSAGETIPGIRRFLEDKHHNFWISSRAYSLYQMPAGENTFKPVPLPEPCDSPISNLIQTRDSNLILVLNGKGLFERRDSSWKQLDINALPDQQVTFAYSNKLNDKIFAYSSENRVMLYNYKTGNTSVVPNFSKPLSSFTLDENGENLWLGTRNFGLYQVSEKNTLFESILVNRLSGSDANYANYMVTMLETSDGTSYFVAGPGMFKRDKTTGEISHIIDYWRPGDFNQGINSMVELDHENLLLATSRGLFKYNRRTKKCGRFHPLEESFSELTIHKNKLWAIGTFGLFRYDLDQRTTVVFRDVANAPAVLKTNMTRKIFIDKEGIVWVGMVREGIYRIEEADNGFSFNQYQYTGERTSGFQAQTVNEIFEDDLGNLWIGGFSSGLLEFNRERLQFINYTPEGELPIPNIQAIQQANDGCLWLSAVDGIHKFIPDTRTFKKYTTSDGLIGNSFILRSSAKTKEGKILFGSNKGITIFDPLKTDLTKTVSHVQIEDINSFNQSLKLTEPILEAEAIDLKYNQNSISLGFLALDFNDAKRIAYAYRLEGLSDTWVNLGSNRNVSLTNLRPGKYNFQVRATLNMGAWSDITSLLIHVKAPFWLKPWFFGLIAALILGLLWLIYRFRLNQKLRRIEFLEDVRQKAAADFHDELGNKLTRIALFTDVLKQKLNGTSQEVTEYVDKIRDNSRSLNSSMRDFLWALDPKKDTAYDLAILLKDFGEELFDKTNVEFRIDCIESNLQRYKLDMDWKRNLILIFKEAMHNVLKHAKATKVSLGFALSEDKVQILLTDNGKGLDEKRKVGGYGIRNMNYRSDQLGGKLTIEESEPHGTFVQFVGNLKEFNIA